MIPFAKTGNGKKALVVIPGLSIKQVSPLIDAVGAQYQVFLDAGYTVYVVDRRVDAPEGYSIEDMARDTAECLSQLGIEKADVLGVSQGGMIALYLAAKCPQLVDHLLVGSSCARANQALSTAARRWIELARTKQVEGLVADFGSQVYSEVVWQANRGTVMAAHADTTDEELSRFAQMAQAVLYYDCRNILPDVQTKTLVVGAQGDRVVTCEGTRELASLLGCESHLYDGSFGHAVYDEAPDFARRLLEFCLKK